eukprot:TRINITY_DN6742_c0_g1_i1.p1 TRINITY_DN6742_c0_g1~~TRINITY_DN6742_c0_g1_i1.p1  ORF type:complete len:1025 (+),score=265.00 TRINITY_DN6742_c0_g1_i1:45-3077(+)
METPFYHRVNIVGDNGGRELQVAAASLSQAVFLRNTWMARGEAREALDDKKEIEEFRNDMEELRRTVHEGSCRSACKNRLDILERKYSMFKILNKDVEESHDINTLKLPVFTHSQATLLTVRPDGHSEPLEEFLDQSLNVPSTCIEIILEGRNINVMPDLAPVPLASPVTNVPDALLLYHIWKRVIVLNNLRRSQGRREVQLSMKATNRDHLIAAFLLCRSVAGSHHLQPHSVLQYLYYLSKIRVLASPIAEAQHAGVPFSKHPFKSLFARGLQVTVVPKKDGLVSEMSVAITVFELSDTDMTELAVHSHQTTHPLAHPAIAHIVPDERIAFRRRTHIQEHEVLAGSCSASKSSPTGKMRGFDQLALESYIKLGRLDINGPPEKQGSPLAAAAELIRECLVMREKYMAPGKVEDMGDNVLESITKGFHEDGVFSVGKASVSLEEYIRDYSKVCSTAGDKKVKEFCTRRLKMLTNKFEIHSSLRLLEETGNDVVGRVVNMSDHRDFYQATIVDTHVHMAGGMPASELLDFIRGKVQYQGDDVIKVEGTEGAHNRKVVTLQDIMDRLNVSAPDLTVSSLGVQADATVFERFDNFNSKYSPLGKTDLRTIFLKTDTTQPDGTDVLEGRYFAELIKKTFRKMAPNHFSEFRLSIYGKSPTEWEKLASWHSTHGMGSTKNKWLIQVPRLYSVLKKNKNVACFGDILRNIFLPLWEASAFPGRHPQLDHFLKHTSGFDSVDSEHIVDAEMEGVPNPNKWQSFENPPYAYWMYYMWANIKALNTYRASRGQTTLSFRPHCGECGDPKHLASTFLTADGVSHGIQLRLAPVLQYLFYLGHIPIAVSPLSNNSLFLDLEQSPFPDFFKRGLNVSLSTDDPLFFHQTQEPLVEEYSVSSKLWRLSSTDLCEIARNSTRQCGFSHETKRMWGGVFYHLDSSLSNDERKTNVPDIRVAFRFEVYHDEFFYLNRVRHVEGEPSPLPAPRFMKTLEVEDSYLASLGLNRAEELKKKMKFARSKL